MAANDGKASAEESRRFQENLTKLVPLYEEFQDLLDPPDRPGFEYRTRAQKMFTEYKGHANEELAQFVKEEVSFHTVSPKGCPEKNRSSANAVLGSISATMNAHIALPKDLLDTKVRTMVKPAYRLYGGGAVCS